MTGLILKLSFNNIGEETLEGGICGSFFFISPNLVVTAQHVLNTNTFEPNIGFNNCQVWLIVQPDIVIELKLNNVIQHPEIDTTIVKLEKDYPIKARKLSLSKIEAEHECYNEGFTGGKMPSINANWTSTGLQITSCLYNGTIANGQGYIKAKEMITVNAKDINMNNIVGLATSYGGVIGMSGGPLVCKLTDEILGLMSIGLPADKESKDSLFAVSIEEINKKIKTFT
jgi:V8-like Glu-specific endopeptidase